MPKRAFATFEYFRRDGEWAMGDSRRNDDLDRLGEMGCKLISTVVFDDDGLVMLTDTYEL